jgi:16S rRNA (adenine1518-N6/adenine1519-N6)-dimethyltransferase
MTARRRFGQHFLQPVWAARVVAAVAPAPEDDFIEIGPVTAFEIDRDLAAALRDTAPANLTVVEGDFLESDWLLKHRPAFPVRVAGNLPYNVASPILFRLIDIFDSAIPLTDATLMLQREVADRLVAPPGTGEYGVLGVLVRLRFHPPAPAPGNRALFTSLVRAVFTRRRKTIENALLAFRPLDRAFLTATLQRAGIDRRRRPETLDIAELVRLADLFSSLPAAAGAVL